MELLQSISLAIASLTPAALALIGVWLAVMVCFPILQWTLGKGIAQYGAVLSVVAQVSVVLVLLAPAWGVLRTTWVALSVVVMGWGVEFLGSKTGFPFGRYHYTPLLQPQVGHVPLVIPLAWLMMLPPAWAVAKLIVGQSVPLFVLVGGLAFTAWDLFLDPQMVGLGLWAWDQPGEYCRGDRSGGIPWVNFAGWAAASASMTAVLSLGGAPFGELPLAPLVLVYGITWLLETVGLGVFWQQPGPATAGFVGMGAMLLWAWLRAG